MRQRVNDEIVLWNRKYKYSLIPIEGDDVELIVTPCDAPTITCDVARIHFAENICTNQTYYRCLIHSGCVKMIEDCSLCDAIRRCMVEFFDHMPVFHSGYCPYYPC